MNTNQGPPKAQHSDGPDIDQIDVTELVKRSPILARLVEEIRLEENQGISGYNRMHNRHNRTIRPRPYPYPQPEPPDVP